MECHCCSEDISQENASKYRNTIFGGKYVYFCYGCKKGIGLQVCNRCSKEFPNSILANFSNEDNKGTNVCPCCVQALPIDAPLWTAVFSYDQCSECKGDFKNNLLTWLVKAIVPGGSRMTAHVCEGCKIAFLESHEDYKLSSDCDEE